MVPAYFVATIMQFVFVVVICFGLLFVVCGQIRAAIGKANLLVNKKFKQFRGLCNKNLVSRAISFHSP